jgi:hypothetical protein
LPSTVGSVNYLRADLGYGECIDGSRHGASVISFTQGLRKNGTPVNANRSDETRALGEPDGLTAGNAAIIGNFTALGFGGSMTIMFDSPIYEMSSDPADPMDLFIYDVTNNPGAYGLETALIEVSHNGTDWIALGEANSQNNFGGTQGATGLDFDSVGILSFIQYVRITDTSDINNPLFPSDADGFDVDAIGGFCGNVIYGQKFNDINQNGAIDPIDPVIDFWGFFIDENDNQTYDFGEIFTHVDEFTGEYYMANLPGNQTYTICEGPAVEEGWTQSYPTDNNGCHIVEVGDTVDEFYGAYDFANYRNTFGVCTDGNRWAGSVVDFSQGLRKDGTPVLPERSNVISAFGAPDGVSGSTAVNGNFVSLGFGGTVTLRLDEPIYEMTSDPANPMDLFIFESTTNPGAYGEERVSVEVSHDGVTWLTLGEASSLDNFEGNQGESGLDFDSIGLLTSIQYVRLTDISNPASFPDDADGYDVDALGGFCGNVIYGQKFNDLDQNGIIDVTDPVIDFWGFFVDENDNQEYDFGEIFTHVDSETGEYYMANLPGNQTYTICEGQVDGWTQTVPADNNGCYDVTIGDTVDDFYGPYNFANYETENAEIIVYKVEDYRDSTESAQPLATSGTWEFEVRDGSDTLIDTIENYDGSTQSVFDETGSYDSASVIPGTYRISEIAQNDFEFSWGRCLDITNAVPNNGTFMIDISSEADIQHAFGPDASGLTPRGDVVGTWDTTDNEFAEVELSQGQRIYCVFYNAPIGSISGLKWSDENANGVNDAEPGLEGWTIFLDENGNGILDNGEESTLTDVDGNYTFDSVRYGDYVVCEVLQNGWAQTYPGTPSDPECHDVVVDDGTPNLVNIDFGNTELSFVQGIKFRDFNGNGVFNILEILNPANYLNDWTINLYDSSWNLIKTMETGDSSTEAGFVLPSQYRFINLTAGTYHICEELVDGWAQTLPSSGPIDPVNNNSFCRTITLTAGDFELFEWFGNYELGEIRGFKWNDLNTNGSVNGGEPRLEGWTIFIDENGNEVLDNGEVSTTTDISGNYVLDNLEIGSYIICEVLINDWAQTFPGDQSDPDCHTRSINFSGQVRNNVNFGNTELGSIAGRKFEDINGNGVLEVNSPDTRENGWSVYLYDSSWNLVDSMVTGSDNSNTNPIHASGNVAAGQYRFNNLVSGTYYVCEEDRDGWVQTGITPDADAVVLVDGSVTEDVAEDCAQVDVAVNEDRGGIRFLNFELVTILVEKDVIDEDSQDVFDSQIFDIALVEDIAGTIGNGQISDDEVSPINSVFEVGPGVYSIDETEIIGYDLISCLDELDRDSFDVVSGEEIVVVCINEQDPAELNGLIQIAKSNETLDAAGNPSETRQPGDIVEFTIEVTLEEDFPELVITDLLSDSFDFNGTYTVFINGSPVAITPTGYTSPGFWEFGGLVDNDVITIVYQAVVQNDTEDGLYKDVAFAEGFNISNVFAQSTGQAGTILTNQFVGTAVQIAAPTDNNAPGVVLGSSTEFLPSTGANTLWLILTMIILMSGIGFTTYAIFSSKETKFEGFKLSFKLPIVLGVAVLSGFVFSFNNKALAAEEDLVLSVEDPDPANQVGIEIDYVALDLQGDAVTTSCTVQRPSGGAFVAMSTTNPSNAGACIADAGILTEQGLYTVRVTATSVNDSDVVDVILLYDSINPSDVTNYSNSFSEGGVCTHTINFTSGAGSTGYQIFRSSATNFSPNSLVDQASTSGGANESFVDNVPCGQDFYYAVRTFDLAGNTSEFATDTVINVVIVPAVPAPVTNPNQVGGIGTDGGDVLGEGTDGNGTTDDGQSGDNNDEDGDVLGEGDESEDGDDASSDDDTDQEGDEDSTNSESEEDSGTNWVIIAALILLIMAGLTGGYLFLTRKKSA